MSTIAWLGAHDPFPNPLLQPDPDPNIPGLVAVSDRIYPGQLAAAYHLGIFPWYSENQPVLWWSPDPRMVLQTSQFRCSHSLRKEIQKFIQDPSKQIQVDVDFESVVRGCATSQRKDQEGTWITHEIAEAYSTLHQEGHAHSIAIIENGILMGGLYCVSFGQMVFGESMFSRKPNVSKLALAALSAWCIHHQITMIDCQQETAHLKSLGANPMPRDEFLRHLQSALNAATIAGPWEFNKSLLEYWL